MKHHYQRKKNLIREDITDGDCQHMRSFWKDFGIKYLAKHQNLYLQSDTPLQENIRQEVETRFDKSNYEVKKPLLTRKTKK